MLAWTPEADSDCTNDLFTQLPFLADALLPLLDHVAVVHLSCTCKAWRQAVQSSVRSLSPKSELAMPFVCGCHHLRRLHLAQTIPAQNTLKGFSLISSLTGLTQLGLDLSTTAAWRGQALQLNGADMQPLTHLQALQVLTLSHQPCLQQPGGLTVLSYLSCLTRLGLSITGTGWTPPYSNWTVLSVLTGLMSLDLSGWSRCTLDWPDDAVRTAMHDATHSRPSMESESLTGGSTQLDLSCSRGRRDNLLNAGQQSEALADSSKGPEVAGALSNARTSVAPLHLLGHLNRLEQLVLAQWDECPSSRGLAGLHLLSSLTNLDLSCLLQTPLPRSSSSSTLQQASTAQRHVPLLSVLCGTAPQQQRQQQLVNGQWPEGSLLEQPRQQPSLQSTARSSSAADAPSAADEFLNHATDTTAVAAAAAAAAVGGATSGDAPMVAAVVSPGELLGRLQLLNCSNVKLVMDERLWAALSGLTHLDVSCCNKLKGHGLSKLQQLQVLVASDCPQLDYDAVSGLLQSCHKLRKLDLQRSTVILHGSGSTAAQLRQGRYRRPALLAQHRQQQQVSAGGGVSTHVHSSSSRRDVADVTGAEAMPGSGISQNKQLDCLIAEAGGLHELLLSGCSLAFEAFVWNEPNIQGQQGRPQHPSLLLFDLIAQLPLHTLQLLHWCMADSHLVSTILWHLVPAAGRSLVHLKLSNSALPEDPSRCWQGLAHATALQQLDLGDTGFSRQGYANSCGTNPTVALLAAVARMRTLQSLGLAGWRFYFATLKPLAGLSGCLSCLDLSHARDVTDSTLWSLTHLTSLTWLSLSGAHASNDQIFSLLFVHFSNLQHLDLSYITNFTSRSIPSLLQLQALTSLDIRSTQATASEAAVKSLLKLPRCQRLALSLGPSAPTVGGFGRDGVQQRRPSVRSHAGEDSCLQEYSHLSRFGQCQSLRQLTLAGSTPALSEYCRSLLPPWVDVR